MEALGPARDGDAAFGVQPEDREDFLRLRATEELLEPRNIFETLLQRLRALIRIRQPGTALQPVMLLLRIQELAQAFAARLAGSGHWA